LRSPQCWPRPHGGAGDPTPLPQPHPTRASMGLRLATRCRGYPGAIVKMTAPALHGGAETHLPTSKPRLLTSTPSTRLNRPRFLPLLCGFGLSVEGLVVDRLQRSRGEHSQGPVNAPDVIPVDPAGGRDLDVPCGPRLDCVTFSFHLVDEREDQRLRGRAPPRRYRGPAQGSRRPPAVARSRPQTACPQPILRSRHRHGPVTDLGRDKPGAIAHGCTSAPPDPNSSGIEPGRLNAPGITGHHRCRHHTDDQARRRVTDLDVRTTARIITEGTDPPPALHGPCVGAAPSRRRG